MFLPTNITLKFGDSGDFVSELQRRLSVVRCFNPDAINGFYDGNTVNAVSQFQTTHGIRADGVAGPETLRRLNGVISGDTSTSSHTDNKAEEEERARQAAAQQSFERQMYIADHPEIVQPQHPPGVVETVASAVAVHAVTHAAEPYLQQQPVAPQPLYEPLHHAQPQPVHQPPAAPTAADLLAQMLMAPPPQQPTPPHHQQHPTTATAPQHPVAPQPHHQASQQPVAQPQTQPLQPQQVYAAVPPQPVQHQPQAHAPQPHHQQPVPQAPQPHYPPMGAAPQHNAPPAQQPQQAQTAAPAPEQQRGIVGRAMQYANEMVQKLAHYFESKLPNHVLAEVKQIGHAMANSGVKEVPIPQGPEQQQQRGIEGPQRQQQQAQHRG